ncbi:MAG: glycogen debranching N-terminal domain-containing protein, partial [Ktedonobacterales bacterium]
VANYGETEATFTLTLRFDADFCHTFEAKHEVQVSKEMVRNSGVYRHAVEGGGQVHRFGFHNASRDRELLVRLSERPENLGAGGDAERRYPLHLAPQEHWLLVIEFVTMPDTISAAQPTITLAADAQQSVWERAERRREQVIAEAPAFATDSLPLRRAYAQSVADFAALQMSAPIAPANGERNPDGDAADEFIIAAGIPWFMTLFGRDSLIAAYQALPFFPDAARGTLRALARLQGRQVDTLRVEEPGKILHEYRSPTFIGAQHSAAVFPYYGTIDATPLFLILLARLYDVTGDLAFARALREPALRALDWMESYGDRDGDGYIEYIREAEAGLDNQGWKDSGDAVRYRDGRLAQAPIALCEVQGYAYAAKLGMAGLFAAFGEMEQASTLRAQAEALKIRFNRDFWMVDRGCYAFGLDGEKRHIDALTSNPGQVLWTGIADSDKAGQVAHTLLAPDMFSGWGVRTMSAGEGGYNPVSYHCGSVWPHDNSLIVAGLARYGFATEARQILAGMLAALEYNPEYRLPELFAGYSQAEAPFPVEYPTACRPQAWAAGSVFSFLATMAQIDPSLQSAQSDKVAFMSPLAAASLLPESVSRIALAGVWRHGERVDIAVTR